MSDLIFAGANRILFHVAIIVVSFLNGGSSSALSGRPEGRSLPLIPADFKKLFADGVFRGVNVLDIRLKKRLIGNASFDEVAQVMLVHLGQRLGRDAIGAPLSLSADNCLQPAFLNPRKNLVFPYTQRSRKTFQREEVAANLSHEKAISLKHAANGFRRPAHSAGDLLDRVPDELLADSFDLLLAPAPVVRFALERILDDKPPARFPGLSAVALKTHHQLFELIAGKNPGLGSERQGLGTPAPGLGVRAGLICHRYLTRGMTDSGARRTPSTYKASQHEESGHVNKQIWAESVETHDAFGVMCRYTQATTIGAGLLTISQVSEHMTSPSPSDLCWVIGFTPKGRWIAPAVRAAVGMELEKAREAARTHLGDEQLALEMMELAIQQTAEYLAGLSPIGVEETRLILMRFYRNEVRRRQRAGRRLTYRGSAMDVERLSPSVDCSFARIEADLDLEAVLNDAPADLRCAMLLRYGSRSQWGEVAEILLKSKEATRKLCERELKKIRKKLEL